MKCESVLVVPRVESDGEQTGDEYRLRVGEAEQRIVKKFEITGIFLIYFARMFHCLWLRSMWRYCLFIIAGVLLAL